MSEGAHHEDRDRYIEKLKADLDRWNEQAREWENKARDTQADLRTQFERQLEVLREQRESAGNRLAELQGASSAAWQEVAQGAELAWKQLQESFDRARSQFDGSGKGPGPR